MILSNPFIICVYKVVYHLNRFFSINKVKVWGNYEKYFIIINWV